MDKWPGAPFFWSLHPAGAQNITLISNTAYTDWAYNAHSVPFEQSKNAHSVPSL